MSRSKSRPPPKKDGLGGWEHCLRDLDLVSAMGPEQDDPFIDDVDSNFAETSNRSGR